MVLMASWPGMVIMKVSCGRSEDKAPRMGPCGSERLGNGQCGGIGCVVGSIGDGLGRPRCRGLLRSEIGRASCRERVWQYVKITGVDGTLKQQKRRAHSTTRH